MLQDEEHSVTELQTKAQPNKAILSKLRMEMQRLYYARVNIVYIIPYSFTMSYTLNALSLFIIIFHI